jgi:hypothetical protein
MSIWYQKKEKNGSTSLTGFDISFELILVFIGLLVAIIAPFILTGQYQLGSLIAAIGFILFFISKVSLFRMGIWRSWGPAHMSKFNRALYIAGYFFMIFGAGLILLIYKVHG